jgi:hypothetical protein
LWLAGSSLGVTVVGEEAKQHALATLDQLDDNPLGDAEGMVVLVEHQTYSYHVVDGADLDKADPPVWLIIEGEDAQKYWPSVTNWFEGTGPSIEEYRARLELMRELGHTSAPPWARHIRLDED